MALHDSDPLLELTLYFLNLLGNFFAIFTGTYDSNAFWEERYLSGNTENYYWHIFCWSFDECDRARVFCWFLLFILIVTLLGLWFTVDSCLSNRKHAAERLTLESELETCRKGRIEDGIKIADLDNSNKLLRDRNGGLEKDLADSRKQAAETAEDIAQLILNANGRAEGFERQLDDARTTNEQLEEKVEALEDLAKSSRDCVGRLEKKVEDLEKKVEDQHKDAEALEDQVGKLLREKADATRQFSRIQTKFVNEESAKTDEMRKARNSKAAEDKATQEASTLKKDLRALQRQLREFEQKQNDVEKTKTQYEQRAARHDEESTRKDAKITSQTEELRQKTTDLETLRNDLEKAKGQTQSHQIKLENVTKEKTELQKRSEEAATHAARQIKQLQQQNSEHETLQDEIREIKSENESLRDELEQANTAVEQTSKLQQDCHKTEHKTLRRTANTPDQHHDNAAERTATNEAGIYTLLSTETTTDSQAKLAIVQTRAIDIGVPVLLKPYLVGDLSRFQRSAGRYKHTGYWCTNFTEAGSRW
jgi:chromosome segregation ATPase